MSLSPRQLRTVTSAAEAFPSLEYFWSSHLGGSQVLFQDLVTAPAISCTMCPDWSHALFKNSYPNGNHLTDEVS